MLMHYKYNSSSHDVFTCMYICIFKVVETLPGFWKSDVDFIKPGTLFTVSWNNVFMSIPDSIKHFNLYLSSFPGGQCTYYSKSTQCIIQLFTLLSNKPH